jgi:exopolysaccharide biosynthesis polyprenyl glycosylphosphotransferase
VVSFALTREADLVDTVITAHKMRCAVLVVPRLFELHHDGPDVERLRGYPLVRLRTDPTTRISWWVKRGFDVLLALLALVLLAPLLTVAAIAVLLESGRPVLFHQTRIGLDSTPFDLVKLRSLRPDSELESQTTWSIANDSRVGKVGRFLRRTSIDELPQLWNILKGEMSFVGPRPERPGYVELFSMEHERYWARHRVPAGLTGLSQVNGLRGDTSIEERARYDNYYIANWSLWLDLRILLLTVREVLRGSGA